MNPRSSIAIALVVVLAASASIANAQAAAGSTSVQANWGFFNFLKPVLVSLLGQTTVDNIQSNIANIVQAVGSGDTAKLFEAALPVIDPFNVIRNGLSALSGYEAQMWNPEFRRQIAGIMQGGAKALISGIQCYSLNLQDNLRNLSIAYVVALEKAYAANTPNTTESPRSPIVAAQTTIVNTARLFLNVLTSDEIRDAVIDGARSLFNGGNVAYQCARADMEETTRSWEALTKLLGVNVSASGGSSAAKAGVSATTAPSRSFFFGLF